jgi:outer membrane biosynthesis protein TonB
MAGELSRMRGRDEANLTRQHRFAFALVLSTFQNFRGIEMKIKLALGALAAMLVLSACAKKEEAPAEPTPPAEAPPAEPAMPEQTPPADPNAPPTDPSATPETPPATEPPPQ